MSIRPQDRDLLRELATQVAEIAALPVQEETISLWQALNRLRPVRPMVAIDEMPWHEMDVDGELTLQTEDDFCRQIETSLRRTLYRWRHLRADMVVEPAIRVPKVIRSTGFGVEILENRAVLDPANDVVGHYYMDQLATDEEVERIRPPEIALDEAATARAEETARDLLDGLLDVHMQGWLPGFAPWDTIVEWHGVGNVLVDLVERPQFMHHIIARLTDAHLALLDQLEAQGLLGPQAGHVHCSGAYTDELPAPGADPARLRPRDLWTSGTAQIFSCVSPAMHQEFELDYAARWHSRFGLVYYGCCEPLHDKIDIIRALPRLRKISMSPWVDVEKGAERIGRDFVFSRKPSPALVAGHQWDPAAVEQDLRRVLDACARHGCPLEFILKDISTVRYQPQRLWEWADIATRVVTQ